METALVVILVLTLMFLTAFATVFHFVFKDLKEEAKLLLEKSRMNVENSYKSAQLVQDSHNNLVTLVAEHSKELANLKQSTEFLKGMKPRG